MEVRAFVAGVNGFVSKSATQEELLSAMKRVVSGAMHFSTEAIGRLARGAGTHGHGGLEQQLSAREVQVAKLLAQGRSNQEIGQLLHISAKTVSVHKHNIFSKLSVANLRQLIDLLESEIIV